MVKSEYVLNHLNSFAYNIDRAMFRTSTVNINKGTFAKLRIIAEHGHSIERHTISRIVAEE